MEEFRLSHQPLLATVLSELSQVFKNSTMAQESFFNKPPLLIDPSCPSLIHCFIQHVKYKAKHGSLSFISILLKSPSIFQIFLEKIKLVDSSFSFDYTASDIQVLSTLLEKVFYPEGFTVEAFQLLISAYPMKTPITVQSAYEYALFIKDVTTSLASILPQAATPISQCWNVVLTGIEKGHILRHKLSSEHPQRFVHFYKCLDRKITSYFELTPSSCSSESTTD